MKSNIFRRLTIALCIAFGVFGLVGCQSVNIDDAKVITDPQYTAVKVYTEEGTGTRYATATIGVKNDSIYDVVSWTFTVETTNDAGTKKTESWDQNMYIGHGASGYVLLTQKLEDQTVNAVEVKSIVRKDYRGLFDTYIAWWIAGIIIAALSIISFAFMIFSGKLTREQAKNSFKANSNELLCSLAFVMLLCLFPLVFGSWVPTVIFTGAILGSLLINGLLTYIKLLFTKE